MLTMMFACSGAGLRTRSPAFGALLLTLSLTLTSVTQVSAVCVHCKGFVEGCAGSSAYPLAKEIVANGAVMEDPKTSKIPTVGYILPPDMLTVFTNNVIEAIVGIASSPPTGRTVDLSDKTEFDKPSKVVRAAFMGHCTIEEAGLELAGRLEEATEMVDVTKVQSAIELLKTRHGLPTKECMQAGQGVYTFIFAKVGQYLEGVKKGTVRLASSAAKAAASDLIATIRAPESSHEFFFMLNDWALVVSALGLIAYPLIIRFIKDTVEYTMVCLKETYQVACCLFLTYLKRIETDPTRNMTLANAYSALLGVSSYGCVASWVAVNGLETRLIEHRVDTNQSYLDVPGVLGSEVKPEEKRCMVFVSTPRLLLTAWFVSMAETE